MAGLDAIYARQSADRADSISIESQIEYCRYETHGCEHLVFADRGYSGKNVDRPDFQRMLGQIKQRKIKRVICYKLDRCSRSILDFANFMEQLQACGTEFVSCTDKFDTSTPMGRAMLNICIVFAQLERETIQQRVTDAYHSRSKRGFYMGGRVPFGYRLMPAVIDGKKTSCYQIYQEEADMIRKLYDFYARPDVSLADVAQGMQAEHIQNPRRTDGKWVRSHIGRLLRNPIYVCADAKVYHYFQHAGVMIQNNEEDFIGTNGCYLYTDKDKNKLLVLAPHAGIVDAQTWLLCRNKSQNRTNRSRYGTKNTWLAGTVKCNYCNYALVIKKSGERRHFICSADVDKRCNGIGAIKAETVETVVEEALLDRIQKLWQEERNDVRNPKQDQILLKQIQSEMNLLVEKLNRIEDHSISNIRDSAVLLKSELSSQPIPQGENVTAHDYKSHMDKIEAIRTEWNRLSIQEKQTVAKSMIKRIRVAPNYIQIFWRV